MKPRPRPLLALIVTLTFLALFNLQREQAALVSAASYSGTARIEGRLQLDLMVSPPVGAPRDTLNLQILLTNHEDTTASPTVDIQLPSNLEINNNRLPSGATINLSSNSIQWLPLVPGQNGTKEMNIPLKIISADLKQPEQIISALLKNGSTESNAAVTIWTGIPPKIQSITNPKTIAVGQPLQLQVEAIGPGPFSETWLLGDGRRLPLNTPSIVYPKAGVYDLTVTVKNPIGSTTYTSKITVVPHASANFRAEDETPGTGEAVAFINESGGQMPLRVTWDFGDGTLSNEAQPQHIYNNPGNYQVRLLVENDYGQSETTTLVTVGSPPSADILVEEFTPAGQQIAGEAVGDAENIQFAWEMGDGRQYDGQKFRHAYRQGGNYYVTLKASNEFGTTQVGKWIHVEPGTLNVYLPIVSHLSGLKSGSSAVSGDNPVESTLEIPEVTDLFEMEPLEAAQSKPPLGQLLLYVNEARRLFDLPPLPESPTLSAAAQKHTEDMASTRHTQHMGSDGSTPAERQLWYGYGQGYAGEATAWGFPDPRQAVEFWVNSPSHRPIILNPYSTEVGVGYSVDYSAPSVWYWTTEFGNTFAPDELPTLRMQSPAGEIEVLNSDTVTFTWNWSQPLNPSEQFSLYFYGPGNPTRAAAISQPILGTRFAMPIHLLDHPTILGAVEWQVKLENNRGVVIAEGPRQKMTINVDPALPTATPIPTIVPTVEVTASPTITPTPTTIPASPTPRPTDPPPPPLVTATPLPSDS